MQAIKEQITPASWSPTKKNANTAPMATHPDRPKAIQVRIRWFRAARTNFSRRAYRLSAIAASREWGAINGLGIKSRQAKYSENYAKRPHSAQEASLLFYPGGFGDIIVRKVDF
jgi:hypothetical protein